MGSGLSREVADLPFGYTLPKKGRAGQLSTINPADPSAEFSTLLGPTHVHPIVDPPTLYGEDYPPTWTALPNLLELGSLPPDDVDPDDPHPTGYSDHLRSRSVASQPRRGLAARAGANITPQSAPCSTYRLGQLCNLNSVGLCGKGFVHLSPNVALLETTYYLQLCCNLLTTLPPEIGYMSNLTVLDLTHNKLKVLPSSIGYLDKLVCLTLTNNQLTQLPPSIGCLPKLSVLHLGCNRLASLPPEIGLLHSLFTLDISQNPIRVLPAELAELPCLRKLRLNRCPLLTSLPLDTRPEAPAPPAGLNPSPARRVPTLAELAARTLVRWRVPVSARLPPHLQAYLGSVNFCTYCHGPYFENCHKRWRFMTKSTKRIPLEYRLCSPHWNTDVERIRAMFAPPPHSGLVSNDRRRFRHLTQLTPVTYESPSQVHVPTHSSYTDPTSSAPPRVNRTSRLGWFKRRSEVLRNSSATTPANSSWGAVSPLPTPGSPLPISLTHLRRLPGHQPYYPVTYLQNTLTPTRLPTRRVPLAYRDPVPLDRLLPFPLLPAYPASPPAIPPIGSDPHPGLSPGSDLMGLSAVTPPSAPESDARRGLLRRPTDLPGPPAPQSPDLSTSFRLSRRMRNPLRIREPSLTSVPSSAVQSPSQPYNPTPSVFSDPNSLAVGASSSIYSFPASPDSLATMQLPPATNPSGSIYPLPSLSLGGRRTTPAHSLQFTDDRDQTLPLAPAVPNGPEASSTSSSSSDALQMPVRNIPTSAAHDAYVDELLTAAEFLLDPENQVSIPGPPGGVSPPSTRHSESDPVLSPHHLSLTLDSMPTPALPVSFRHSTGGHHSAESPNRPTGLAALKPYTAVKAQRYSYSSGAPLLPNGLTLRLEEPSSSMPTQLAELTDLTPLKTHPTSEGSSPSSDTSSTKPVNFDDGPSETDTSSQPPLTTPSKRSADSVFEIPLHCDSST
ncbi:hypothetical protein H4R33_000758 [Dimargaris cristalligena]|nr:hypothetical protein H4R33_000758 [Dimargaris cristalligena]